MTEAIEDFIVIYTTDAHSDRFTFRRRDERVLAYEDGIILFYTSSLHLDNNPSSC